MFEQYVKERAEEERRDKHRKMKERKDLFRQLLEEAKVHIKYAGCSYIRQCLVVALFFSSVCWAGISAHPLLIL